jgi:hypothetical protein
MMYMRSTLGYGAFAGPSLALQVSLAYFGFRRRMTAVRRQPSFGN